MTTLSEFLLARYAEEEADAQYAQKLLAATGTSGVQVGGVKVYDPARVLAECKAKRRIVGLHTQADVMSDTESFCSTCAIWDEAEYNGGIQVLLPCPTLLALALPYADHPDYQREWRP